MPRRARPLVPAGLPYGRETAAACAILVLLAHLLLAPLTLLLVVTFAVTSRLSRWRLWWLAVPVAAGLVLTAAAGPGTAASGFAAGPAHFLASLGHGRLADRLAHPAGALGGAGSRLPGQLPIALILAAAEAAAIGWLDWRRTDEWAVAPRRPGAIAALRGVLAARLIRTGGVLTRTGCALGVVTGTGAVAELRWSQVAGGALVTGASAREVTITSLQLVHAALRRRQPLIVLDAGDGTGDSAAIARAVAAACRATRTPLGELSTGFELAIGERAAALVTARSPERAVAACAELAALADRLGRIGVDGDGLIWVPHGERLPAASLSALIRAGGPAGLGVLIGTVSPAAAAELAGLARTLLIHRVADPELAASLAGRTGVRLRPVPAVSVAAAGGTGLVSAAGATGLRSAAGLVPGPAPGPVPGPVPGPEPGPVVEARTLLSLRPGRFVLMVSEPGQPWVRTGRMVAARLPREDPTVERATAADEAARAERTGIVTGMQGTGIFAAGVEGAGVSAGAREIARAGGAGTDGDRLSRNEGAPGRRR